MHYMKNKALSIIYTLLYVNKLYIHLKMFCIKLSIDNISRRDLLSKWLESDNVSNLLTTGFFLSRTESEIHLHGERESHSAD